MTLAVFDIDGTLVSGSSTERGFFRWLWSQGELDWRQLLAFTRFSSRWGTVYGRHTFKKNKAYLDGLDIDVVADSARRYVQSDVRARYYGQCVSRLRAHLASGDHVVLLTGTLTPIAIAIADTLDVGCVIATECATVNGRYTADPPLTHPFGDEKRALLQAERRRLGASGSPVFAYNDSVHDIPLLECVEHPVCVRPDRGLRAHAETRRWEIIDGDVALQSGASMPESGGGPD